MPTVVTPGKRRVDQILNRHKKLKAVKAPWLPMYQTIGEYVFSRKQNFTNTNTPGKFLTGKIFDSTAASANHLMASTLIGALYPNGAKTFQILPPTRMPKEQAEKPHIKQFFERISRRMAEALDHPRAGLIPALEEYMLDQGSFGISGIMVERTGDPAMPVRFTAVDAKKICIEEGADGFVNTVYIETEMTVAQLVEKFSEEELSQQAQEMYKDENRCHDKIKVLHAIEPRPAREIDPNGEGVLNAPVRSLFIETEHEHEIRESGFEEMPVFITRFWKAMGEIYGRSPAMEGISDIMEINTMREASIVATEKLLDPPLVLKHDGSLGGGVLDTSAGAVNVQYVSGRIGDTGKIVEQIITIGELNSTFKRIDELREIIFNLFFIDRLLDLNNETRMTYGEAQIRNELRGQSLGTIYARQISELFNPVIERVFNIMYNDGLLGVEEDSDLFFQLQDMGITPEVIPAEIVDLINSGEDAYRVHFISPAARIMRAEELAGIMRATDYALQTAGMGVPDILDNIDWDVVMRKVIEYTGASAEILKDGDTIAQMREARAQQQQAMAQLEAGKVQAETAKAGAQAAQAAAKAGAMPGIGLMNSMAGSLAA
jgi:hypothetical protein